MRAVLASVLLLRRTPRAFFLFPCCFLRAFVLAFCSHFRALRWYKQVSLALRAF